MGKTVQAHVVRFPFPLEIQSVLLDAALVSHLTIDSWQERWSLNIAFQRAAASLPRAPDGSSAGLLLLGTFSTHQKAGDKASAA